MEKEDKKGKNISFFDKTVNTLADHTSACRILL